MVTRIRMDPEVFRLSKPGFDVLSAGPTQLMFDGNWPGSAKFIKGSVTGSRSGSGNSDYTVAFGKTFSNVPTVFVNVIGNNGGDISFPGVAFPMASVSGGSTGLTNFTVGWSVFRLTVRLSDMTFRIGSNGDSMFYTIEYAVMDYRVGF